MKTKMNIDEILARHFANEPLADAGQAILDSFQSEHKQEYDRMVRLMQRIDAGRELPGKPLAVDVEAAWQKVECRLEEERKPLLVRLRPVLGIAASLLLLIGAAVFFYGRHSGTQLYANTGNTGDTILLKDGSRVVLYPHSELSFTTGDKSGRVASLTGKAFFNVRHTGQPFTVEADELDVRVLGTSFMVDGTKEGSERVSVSTGRVQVVLNEQTAVLTRGEQISVSAGQLGSKTRMPGTRDGRKTFVFRDTPISEAVRQIEKEMDVEIRLEADVASGNRVTTRLDISEPSEAVRELSMLCNCRYDSVSPLKYRMYR
ncbi:FecR family protein [Prevotella dentasini]